MCSYSPRSSNTTRLDGCTKDNFTEERVETRSCDLGCESVAVFDLNGNCPSLVARTPLASLCSSALCLPLLVRSLLVRPLFVRPLLVLLLLVLLLFVHSLLVLPLFYDLCLCCSCFLCILLPLPLLYGNHLSCCLHTCPPCLRSVFLHFLAVFSYVLLNFLQRVLYLKTFLPRWLLCRLSACCHRRVFRFVPRLSACFRLIFRFRQPQLFTSAACVVCCCSPPCLSLTLALYLSLGLLYLAPLILAPVYFTRLNQPLLRT